MAPELMDRSLWEASGHWEKFGENMFTTQTPDERVYAIKPMNCPGHVQIFKQGLRSYRDLPIRFAEFGKVHRYEPSGALHGLMRVRAFTQDDAHIFCTEDQITAESGRRDEADPRHLPGLRLRRRAHQVLRPPGEAGRLRRESGIGPSRRCRRRGAAGLEYTLNPGEGAFYGPKLEFVLRDAIGRDWQCGTLQVDLNLPGRLGATLHRRAQPAPDPGHAPPGHFRLPGAFFGILLEHHAGRLPAWLAPTQAP
jgi:threonyl-tRNA synthetase